MEGSPGRPPQFVAAGVVRTPSDLNLAARLMRLEQGIEEWIARFVPDAVAVERVFAQHNLQSVTDTAMAAGVGLLVSARRGLPSRMYTPSEVKAAVTGSGRADKAQVGSMVARVLKLATPPKPADAADAVALAICDVWRGGTTNRYAEAAAKIRSRA